MHEITLPKLGLSMEKGTIIQWFKNVGDRIEKGEVLFEVEADKANIEVESYHSGYLLAITRQEGEELPINTVVGYIGEEGEKVPDSVSDDGTTESSGEGPEVRVTPESAPPSRMDRDVSPGGTRLRISPVARKMAREHQIDVVGMNITGTGHGGRIRKIDILNHIQNRDSGRGMTQDTGAAYRTVPLSGVRKVIADRMVLSKSTIPHFVLNTTVNVGRLMALRRELNAIHQTKDMVRLTYTDFILKICSKALQEHETINATCMGDEIRYWNDINIGLAVSSDSGLVVPTLRKCHRLTLPEMARERMDIIQKARGGKLTPDDMAGGTFTLTNLGMHNIRSFSAIINPPQAAILAVGAIHETAVATNGQLAAGHCMNLSLSVDHRVVDGSAAAAFMDRLAEILENPALLAAL